jgi:hypothetical protein
VRRMGHGLVVVPNVAPPVFVWQVTDIAAREEEVNMWRSRCRLLEAQLGGKCINPTIGASIYPSHLLFLPSGWRERACDCELCWL